MPSRDASGEPLRRIKHALNLWAVTGYVAWDDQPHIAKWLAENIDRARYSNADIGRLMHEFVSSGGRIVEQDQPPEWRHLSDCFYYVEMPIDGREVFIKFILAPDEEDEPGILIVNIHWPGK